MLIQDYYAKNPWKSDPLVKFWALADIADCKSVHKYRLSTTYFVFICQCEKDGPNPEHDTQKQMEIHLRCPYLQSPDGTHILHRDKLGCVMQKGP